MSEKLPTKLKKEPLLDAVFEMRFTSPTSASSILPGFLFGKLDGEKSTERLPTEQLPKALLDSDPNLRFAPLVRLHWGKFVIAIGDRSLQVSYKGIYPGWPEFKPAILTVVNALKESGIVQSVQRFSMKYIDLIPILPLAEQVLAINASIVIGNHKLEDQNFSLRMEIPGDGLLHAVQIISSAVATEPDGSSREGIIIDIDTISNLDNPDFGYWIDQLPDRLEFMHQANKKMFFTCLRQKTIESLEPVYD